MATWILSKDFTFEASHQLPYHDGKCSRLHGHSWKGTVTLIDHSLHQEGAKTGMVEDYGDMGRAVNSMVTEYLDHYHLNKSLHLDSPTSEEIARWVFNYLKPSYPDRLLSVTIQETCTARCTYTDSEVRIALES